MARSEPVHPATSKLRAHDRKLIRHTRLPEIVGNIIRVKANDVAFEFSAQDQKPLKFASLFQKRFMDIRANQYSSDRGAGFVLGDFGGMLRAAEIVDEGGIGGEVLSQKIGKLS